MKQKVKTQPLNPQQKAAALVVDLQQVQREHRLNYDEGYAIDQAIEVLEDIAKR